MSTEPLKPIHADVGFVKPTEAFTILNSSTEPIEFRYNGEIITVPARDKVVNDGARHISARDTEGRLIPGTAVIRDIINYRIHKWPTDTGGVRTEPEHWIARDALRMALQINVDSGTMGAMEAHRGLSILKETPTPAEVAEADASGKERAQKWEMHKALSVWSAFQGKVEAEKRAGLPPSAPGEAEIKAKMMIDALSRKESAELAKKYGFRQTAEGAWESIMEPGRAEDKSASSPTAPPPPPPRSELTDEEQAEALVKALANPKARKILDEFFSQDRSGGLRKRRTPKSKQPSRKRDPKTKNSAKIQVPEDY